MLTSTEINNQADTWLRAVGTTLAPHPLLAVAVTWTLTQLWNPCLVQRAQACCNQTLLFFPYCKAFSEMLTYILLAVTHSRQITSVSSKVFTPFWVTQPSQEPPKQGAVLHLAF